MKIRPSLSRVVNRQRTGVPQWLSSQYKNYEDNQVLRARMRQIEIKERNNDGIGGL